MKTTNQAKWAALVVGGILVGGADAQAAETDDRIAAAARSSYVFQTYLKDDRIEIESTAGIVTLTGMVAKDTHKAMAERVVESLPGVKVVHNRLAVRGETAAERSDTWISARVTSTLTFHRNVDGERTKVVTKNGRVTLSGEATSAAQRDLTAEYAKDVHGVKGVTNNMTVVKVAKGPEDKTIANKIGDSVSSVGEAMGGVKESIDDASITALVKMTLLYHQSTSALHTTVKTNDGVVTLGGQAKNAAERDLATKLIGDVRGVRTVVNDMAI